jgi:uncharacterized protein (TIGR03118 family)
MPRSSPFKSAVAASAAFAALCAGGGIAQAQFKQTDLVSDIPGLAKLTDSNLVNTWGIVAIPGGSPFWIDNQGTGTSSLFAVTGATGVTAVDPPGSSINFAAVPPGSGLGLGPTGIVANTTGSFGIAGGPAIFMFANLNGTISAWNLSNVNSATQNAATVAATTSGASFTGLGIDTADGLLFAANGNGGGSIQVFNSSFANVTTAGEFVDPSLPSGLVPFNVEDIGGTVYVAYAPSGHANQVDAPAGSGVIATFTQTGAFIKTLVSGGALASPWGMAIAPDGFGALGGDLLVGNFSGADGDVINVFNASTGAFVTSIDVDPGAGNTPGGLWGLMFGGGGPSGDPLTLYFADGINGEKDGLFGALSAPEASTWAMLLVGFGGLALLTARRRRLSPAMS